MQQNPTQDMQPQLSAVCSMTGYGRARQMIGNKEITVELRSVNHRFLEYSSRVPRAYAYLEDKLKNLVKGSVSRGKVDVTLSVQTISGTDTQVVINHDLARSYLEALRCLRLIVPQRFCCAARSQIIYFTLWSGLPRPHP